METECLSICRSAILYGSTTSICTAHEMKSERDTEPVLLGLGLVLELGPGVRSMRELDPVAILQNVVSGAF